MGLMFLVPFERPSDGLFAPPARLVGAQLSGDRDSTGKKEGLARPERTEW